MKQRLDSTSVDFHSETIYKEQNNYWLLLRQLHVLQLSVYQHALPMQSMQGLNMGTVFWNFASSFTKAVLLSIIQMKHYLYDKVH